MSFNQGRLGHPDTLLQVLFSAMQLIFPKSQVQGARLCFSNITLCLFSSFLPSFIFHSLISILPCLLIDNSWQSISVANKNGQVPMQYGKKWKIDVEDNCHITNCTKESLPR